MKASIPTSLVTLALVLSTFASVVPLGALPAAGESGVFQASLMLIYTQSAPTCLPPRKTSLQLLDYRPLVSIPPTAQHYMLTAKPSYKCLQSGETLRPLMDCLDLVSPFAHCAVNSF